MPENLGEMLVAAGEFRQAAEWFDSKTELTCDQRVYRAHVELEVGDSSTALRTAQKVLRERIEDPCKAYCLNIIGRALGRLGSIDEGLAYIRKSVALASTRRRHLEATFRADLVSALLNWVGAEPAMAELPRLRRIALETGNTQALIEYHLIYAKISAIREWWDRADAELEVATDLLLTYPNLYQLWKAKQARCNIAIKRGELYSARSHADECLLLAEQCGARFALSVTLENLAHISVRTGDHTEARKFLQRTLDLLDPLSPLRAAAYSTGIELGLAGGDTDYARQMVRAGEQIVTTKEERSYYELWWELNRLRWLIACGNYHEAARAAASLPAAASLADADLVDRMKLVAAEALYKSGKETTASAMFRTLFEAPGGSSLETLADANRVAALLTAPTDPSSSTLFLRRARRMLVAAGLPGLLRDIEVTSKDLNLVVEGGNNAEGGNPANVVEGIALAIELGIHLPALGMQLLALVSATQPNIRVALISEQLGGHPNPQIVASVGPDAPIDDHPTTLPIGTVNGRLLGLKLWLGSDARAKLFVHSLKQIITSAVASASSRASHEESIERAAGDSGSQPAGMVTAANSMLELLTITRRLATSSVTVLISGETGTGKEVLARVVHDTSPRASKPFIPFNCSAVSREMLDAQLFGYRRGAFTGAHEAFQGVIRAAAGGTLFLDEIGELSPEVQPKLLRFLESGEIHPLGEAKPITVDVRVVAATNANLEQLVADGRFREDLFYRLNVVRLEVPPLRERREEIPILVQHYLERASRESQKTGIRIAEETMEYLVLYKWPGNVRQLANEVRRLVALAESGAIIMPEHLSRDIAASRRTIPASERDPAPTEFVVRMDQPMSAATEHLERSMIQYAMRLTDGRLEDAAQLLGLSRKGLYLKRQRLGIEPAQSAPDESGSDPIDPPISPTSSIG